MYYFSQKFLDGLHTKSENFQNKFFEIIDDICKYLDNEEQKQEFQNYIEQNHSYAKPGNFLFSTQVIMCGKHDDFEKLKERIHFELLGLFDDFEAEEAITTVPHVIVCVSAPDGCFSDKDIKFVENLISFERFCRGCAPVSVTSVFNDTSAGRGTSLFVACLK